MIFDETLSTNVPTEGEKQLESHEMNDESEVSNHVLNEESEFSNFYDSEDESNTDFDGGKDEESSSSSSSSMDDDANAAASTIENNKKDEAPASVTNAEKRSGLFLSLEMVKALRISTSDGKLNSLVQDESLQKMIPKSSSVNAVQSKMIYAIQIKSAMVDHAHHPGDESIPKPKELLKSILVTNDISWELTNEKNTSANKKFVQGSVNGYNLDLMSAVKKGDVDTIRQLHKTNPNMNFQLCNRFGESIVHAAARHGHYDILHCLVTECNVSMYVKCDGGRNVLHDACWTGKPNFTCILYIIENNPELLLLLISDNRGFAPFDYIPKDIHNEWNQFIYTNENKIIKLLSHILL